MNVSTMDSYAPELFFNNTSESFVKSFPVTRGPPPDRNFIRRAVALVLGEASTAFVKSNPEAVTEPRNVVSVFCALVHAGLEVLGKAEGHRLG